MTEPITVTALRLNGPMLTKLRKCAADTSSNWDEQITIYPPEARELVALIDAALADPLVSQLAQVLGERDRLLRNRDRILGSIRAIAQELGDVK